MRAKKIMIQGTMSNSGKSFLTAALCRIFVQDGYRTAPFKSQNMALNSYITEEGLEIGRAQAMQAEAAKIRPAADMNPILLKPTSQMGSQVIVRGEVAGNWKAMDYYRRKAEFIPVIRQAFDRLEEQYDVIVLEGAGSPAEINLRENDIVNMGMAEMAEAPVLLVGDIDRGGVFASLYGTVMLLEPDERARIKGLVINKFRGDMKLLEPGLKMIEERLKIPVVGVIPMESIDLDDEDSLSDRLNQDGSGGLKEGKAWPERKFKQGKQEPEAILDIAVIRFPHISNFTDFNCLERRPGVSLRYVDHVLCLGSPDLVILPGTKNTMADLAWLREGKMESAVLELTEEKKAKVIGICGGYQMLGRWLRDPEGAEGEAGGCMKGMGLLPVETVFSREKTRTRIRGTLTEESRMFAGYSGEAVEGYEIHMGQTMLAEDQDETETARCDRSVSVIQLSDGRPDGMERADGRVLGSYLHGLFDNGALTEALLENLARQKGPDFARAWTSGRERKEESAEEYKEKQYDKLADLVRRSLDMEKIYEILESGGGSSNHPVQ